MAQAGMHALVGTATRKMALRREWLMLGIILGSLFPDLDNYFVAIATLTGSDTHGLHRTFTHSLFTIVVIVAVFYAIGLLRRQPRWTNLGLGLGLGVALHIALDLLIWFNGVELLWPLGGWLNLWEGVTPPAWFAKLMEPAEFLFFALFFLWLASAARAHKTNLDFLGKLRIWAVAMLVLLVVFAPLAYTQIKFIPIIHGTLYLVSITAAFFITIRMRQTVDFNS